jgi:uncharacterized protein (DUF2384 family)
MFIRRKHMKQLLASGSSAAQRAIAAYDNFETGVKAQILVQALACATISKENTYDLYNTRAVKLVRALSQADKDFMLAGFISNDSTMSTMNKLTRSLNKLGQTDAGMLPVSVLQTNGDWTKTKTSCLTAAQNLQNTALANRRTAATARATRNRGIRIMTVARLSQVNHLALYPCGTYGTKQPMSPAGRSTNANCPRP